MITTINNWMDEVIKKHSSNRKPCSTISKNFTDFFPQEFLENSFFVVVDKVPKPDFLLSVDKDIDQFLEINHEGITYKDTYFIRKDVQGDLELHFHELIHVAQYNELGALQFIERYIREIKQFSYEDAPLEKMAYFLQNQFESSASFDALNFVKKNI